MDDSSSILGEEDHEREAMFDDEELLPGGDTPTSVWNPPSELPPPSGASLVSSGSNHQFDPFAPTEDDCTNKTSPEEFRDEVIDLLGATTTNTSQGSTPDNPILIPMNPDADADLLGGVLTKAESKNTKDAKITDITYVSGDGVEKPSEKMEADESDEKDAFVDDDDKNAPEGGASKFGGFFSRMRHSITGGSNSNNNDDYSGVASVDVTNTHALAKESSLLEPPESVGSGLEVGGNSLPHPDTILKGSTRDFLDESSDDDSENGLDANGNSLPHPDEVPRVSKVGSTAVAGNVLDANGNSLPHPDEVLQKGAGNTSFPGNVLDANGNSLPHPDEILRKSGVSNTGNNEDTNMLDENGNSLPHPDTMIPLNDTVTPFLGRSESNVSSNSNQGSVNSGDKRRLLDALDDASNRSDSEVDFFEVEDDEDERADAASTSNSSASGSDHLDRNGNSLPHPDDMVSDYDSGKGIPSFRWGSFRMSLRSTFSKSQDPEGYKGNNDRGFLEQWGSNKGEDAERGFEDEDGIADRTESRTNGNGDSSDDDSDSGSETKRQRKVDEKRRRSVLDWISDGVRSAPRIRSASREPIACADSGDEEMAYGANHEDDCYRAEDDDDFGDESDRLARSKKERLKALLREQRDNPTSRWLCLFLCLFVLLLIIVLPLTVGRKDKALAITNTPTSSPSTSPFNITNNCIDEIVLTDEDGNNLQGDVTGNVFEENVPCYKIDEPVHFRFKRCRPASPMDWVGLYPAGSIFMDKLWKDYVDGLYLCGGQPCPVEDPNNMVGGPPRELSTKTPPISTPGEYRFFLVKDSEWPFEYIKHTPAFQVVKHKHLCPNYHKNEKIDRPWLDDTNSTEDDEILLIDGISEAPTWAPTTITTTDGTGTVTGTTSYVGTTALTGTGTSAMFWTGSRRDRWKTGGFLGT